MEKGYEKLTPEEEKIIVGKGTEAPFSGKYNDWKEKGVYVCKRCGAGLYRSDDKFDSGCGWPSFDDEIAGAVKRIPDKDGQRTEIVCNNCGAHLGHVFLGEGLTEKDVRHCVNSLSLNFKKENDNSSLEKAYFAGGCFWGTQHCFQEAAGVVSTRAGYMGGHKDNPTYEEVCTDATGHAETVEVVFDPSQTSFEELARLFFEIHDPTQIDRQGPDIGQQYRSSIFYTSQAQKETAEKLIAMLQEKGYEIATELTKADTFWPAEEYHQDYYSKQGVPANCHVRKKRF
jgi:peptide methionine sulfoxide reductase msrA/msrB